jgi:hypothetical protein
MKTIKTNTTAKTLKNRFKVGLPICWTTTFFDGRATDHILHEGTVVKVNRVTVDVALGENIVRLDAWDLATAH